MAQGLLGRNLVIWGGRELEGVAFAPFCTIQVLKLHPNAWLAGIEIQWAGQEKK